MATSRQSCTLCEKNEEIRVYCVNHDQKGCSLCMMRKHRACKDIVFLDDIKQNDETIRTFSEILKSVDILFDSAESTVKTESENNDKCRKKSLASVIEARKVIDQRLDEIQKSAESKIDKRYTENRKNITSKQKRLHESKEKITEHRSTFESLSLSGQYAQLHVDAKRKSSQIVEIQKELKSLSTVNVVQEFSFSMNKDMKSFILNKTLSFGTIEEIVTGSDEFMATQADQNTNPRLGIVCNKCQKSCAEERQLSCKHSFCTACSSEMMRSLQPCPTCNIITGNQPTGSTMTVSTVTDSKDYGYHIRYVVPDGTQQAEHPRPGSGFTGYYRNGFWCDDKILVAMLKVAFKRRLIFTVRIQGDVGRVAWNVEHRRPFAYLDNEGEIRRQLVEFGITDKDIDKGKDVCGTITV